VCRMVVGQRVRSLGDPTQTIGTNTVSVWCPTRILEELRVLSEHAKGLDLDRARNGAYAPTCDARSVARSLRCGEQSGRSVRLRAAGLDRPGVPRRKPMRIRSRIEQPTIGWDEQSRYPNELAAGSPEHSGAHSRLLDLAIGMESGFEPYGKRSREGEHWQDCSCGCRHFAALDRPLGADWGVCMNKNSPRAGLLTFEHQGCPAFDVADRREYSRRRATASDLRECDRVRRHVARSSCRVATRGLSRLRPVTFSARFHSRPLLSLLTTRSAPQC